MAKSTDVNLTSIYVRFFPQIERHVSKLLGTNEISKDIAQDAFLYLLTAAPELPTEIDILRFLKWKSRNLALDHIRARSRSGQSESYDERNVTDIPSQKAEDQPEDNLVKAEEAAIVRRALASLTPAHRSVLIEAHLLEIPQADMAATRGVTDNTVRQLLFRARSSFKHSLESETRAAGTSISELLGTKAARSFLTKASLLLIPFFGLISLLPLSNSSSIEFAMEGEILFPEKLSVADRLGMPNLGTTSIDSQLGGAREESKGTQPALGNIREEVQMPPGQQSDEFEAPDRIALISSETDKDPQFESSLDMEQTIALMTEDFSSELNSVPYPDTFEDGLTNNYDAVLSEFVRASFRLVDIETSPKVEDFFLTFDNGSIKIQATPRSSLSALEMREGEVYVHFAATDFVFGDFSGQFDFKAESGLTWDKNLKTYLEINVSLAGEPEALNFRFFD